MKKLIVAAALAVAGCGSNQVITATPTDILIKLSFMGDLAARGMAESHCAKFNKDANRVGYYGYQDSIDQVLIFRCVEKAAATR